MFHWQENTSVDRCCPVAHYTCNHYLCRQPSLCWFTSRTVLWICASNYSRRPLAVLPLLTPSNTLCNTLCTLQPHAAAFCHGPAKHARPPAACFSSLVVRTRSIFHFRYVENVVVRPPVRNAAHHSHRSIMQTLVQ